MPAPIPPPWSRRVIQLVMATALGLWTGPTLWGEDTAPKPETPALQVLITDQTLHVRAAGLTAFDSKGQMILASGEFLAADQFVRMEWVNRDPPRTMPIRPMVLLTDGQRLRPASAMPLGTTDNGLLRLPCGVFGETAVSLDNLVSWSASGEPLAPAKGKDLLTLADGQELTGTVLGFTGTGIKTALRFKAQGQELSLPFKNITSLRLTAPEKRTPFTGIRIALADGSLIAAQGIKWLPQSGQWLIQGALGSVDRQANVATKDLRSLEMGQTNRLLQPIQSLPLNEEGPTCTLLGVSYPPKMDSNGLHLHAPQALRIDIPEGTRYGRLHLCLELPASATAAEQRLAGCRLTLRTRSGGEKTLSLTAEHPAEDVYLSLSDKDLDISFRADSGPNGPILDRILIAGEFLVETPAR